MIENKVTDKDYPLFADHFLSQSGLNTFLQIIIVTFTSNVNHLINGQAGPEPAFDTTIHLIQAIFSRVREEPSLLKSLLPDIFLLAYLGPHVGNEGVDITLSSSHADARTLWTEWLDVAADDEKLDVLNIVKGRLRDIVQDTSVNPT